MPTRVVVGLHVAWMVVIVGLALCAGWLFRFEGNFRDGGYLDRWRGEVVQGGKRISLRQPVRHESPVKDKEASAKPTIFLNLTTDQLNELQPVPQANGQRSGAFDDPSPNRGRQ